MLRAKRKDDVRQKKIKRCYIIIYFFFLRQYADDVANRKEFLNLKFFAYVVLLLTWYVVYVESTTRSFRYWGLRRKNWCCRRGLVVAVVVDADELQQQQWRPCGDIRISTKNSPFELVDSSIEQSWWGDSFFAGFTCKKDSLEI